MGLLYPSPSESLNQIASFSLKVDGTSIGNTHKIFSMKTRKEVNKLSRATISIIGGDPKQNNFDLSEESIFTTGSEIEISFGYDQTNEIVFKGIIDKHSLSIKKGFQSRPSKNLLVLECVDKAVILTNTYTSDIYESKKDSDIITALISNVSGVTNNVSATTITHDFLPKYNSNDWDFILQRAEANGMIIFNSDNNLTISEPMPLVTLPELTLIYGDGMVDFEGEVNASSQYSTFDLNTYDPYNEESEASSKIGRAHV